MLTPVLIQVSTHSYRIIRKIKNINMAGFLIQIFARVILLGTVFATPFQELHHQMSPEERLKVFKTMGPDVPPYEVVEIHSPRVQKRGAYPGQNFKLRAFGQVIEHFLTPLEDVLVTNDTVIGEVSTRWGSINRETYFRKSPVNINEIYRHIYQDKSYAITLSIKNHGGRKEMNGYIGYKNWHVSPVPERLRKSLNVNRSRRSLDENEVEDDDDKVYHIIHQIPNSDGRDSTDPLLRVRRSPLNAYSKSGSKYSVGRIVYPEILVIVDYHLFKILNGSMVDTITYVIAFWNGVDIMYRDLDDPPVRLNIATILVAQDHFALDYIKWYQGDKVIANETLYSKPFWLRIHSESLIPSTYDVTLTMIGTYKMGSIQNGKYEKNPAGIAFTKSACHSYLYPIYKAGIFADVGNYFSIRAAAHELGHMLGSKHDQEEGCEKDGGILDDASSTYDKSDYTHSFSDCSRKQFKEFFKQSTSLCLWDDPTFEYEKSFPRLLPGQLISPKDLCKQYLDGYPNPVIGEKMCRKLVCSGVKGEVTSGWPAPDGTTCEKNKICLHGSCVDEKKVFEHPRSESRKNLFKN